MAGAPHDTRTRMTRTSLLPAVLYEERTKLVPAMLAFSSAAGGALIARTAGTTLFHSRFTPGDLPAPYAAAAISVLAVSLLLGALSARYGRRSVLVRAPVALAAFAVLVALLLASSWRGAGVLAYLLGELSARIPALLFWSEAALVFNPR